MVLFKLLSLFKVLKFARIFTLGLFGISGTFTLTMLCDKISVYWYDTVIPFGYNVFLILFVFFMGLCIHKYLKHLEKVNIENNSETCPKKTIYSLVLSNIVYFMFNILPAFYSLYITFNKKPDTFGVIHKFAQHLEIRRNYEILEKKKWLLDLETSLQPRTDLWNNLIAKLDLNSIDNKAQLYLYIHEKMLEQHQNVVNTIATANYSVSNYIYDFITAHPYACLGFILTSAVSIYFYRDAIYNYVKKLDALVHELIDKQHAIMQTQAIHAQQQQEIFELTARLNQLLPKVITKEELDFELAKLKKTCELLSESLFALIQDNNSTSSLRSDIVQSQKMIEALYNTIREIAG